MIAFKYFVLPMTSSGGLEELPRDMLTVDAGRPLGVGEFGEVWFGQLTTPVGPVLDVAVKTCKSERMSNEVRCRSPPPPIRITPPVDNQFDPAASPMPPHPLCAAPSPPTPLALGGGGGEGGCAPLPREAEWSPRQAIVGGRRCLQ